MQTEPALGRPSTRRTVGFFQLTQILGGVLLALSGLAGRLLLKLPLALSTIAGASIFSMFATLPLSLLGLLVWWWQLAWMLGAPTVLLRWIRVFAVQGVILGLLTGLLYLPTPAGYKRLTWAFLGIGTCFFVAGLLAAGLAYARWLWPARWAGHSAKWP